MDQFTPLQLSCNRFVSLSAFTSTVKLRYGFSSIMPFNWTTVLIPAYRCRGRIDFFVRLGYGRRRYAPFSWLLLDFLPVSQTSYKQLASGWQNPCRTVKSWTILQRCTLHILLRFRSTLPLVLTGFLFSSRLSSKNLCCLSSRSKTSTGTIDHVPIA